MVNKIFHLNSFPFMSVRDIRCIQAFLGKTSMFAICLSWRQQGEKQRELFKRTKVKLSIHQHRHCFDSVLIICMFCMSLFISGAVSSPLLLDRYHHQVVGTCSVINIFM